LQFAATRLWDSRDRNRKLLTITAYNQMGGVGGAFARHADEVAAGVPPQQQALLRAVMMRLVTPEGTRAVVDHNELLGLASDGGDVQQIIDQLVRARLIHLHTDPTSGATVEIVHEVLITEWPTLKRWLEDNQALRGFMHELQQATRQWAARGRPGDLVWRGATAQEALAIETRHVLELSAVERAFLTAVKHQLARGRRRTLFGFTAVFIVLGLVIAGGAVAVFRISAAEQEAKQKAIAADEEAQRAKEAEAQVRGQLAAVEAAKKGQTDAEKIADEKKALAAQANASLNLSREELQKKNLELERTAAEARAAQAKAEKATKDALVSAETARQATLAANKARDDAARLLAQEKARNALLEQQKKSIATDLKGN